MKEQHELQPNPMNIYLRFFVILVGIVLLASVITGVTQRKTLAQDIQRRDQERAQQLANLPPGTEAAPSAFYPMSSDY